MIRKHLEPQKQLANMYRTGKGAPQDSKKAFHWMKIAAEQNDAEAQFMIGLFYDQGYGVKKDLSKRTPYYIAAAENHYPDAQFQLALIRREEKISILPLNYLKRLQKLGKLMHS